MSNNYNEHEYISFKLYENLSFEISPKVTQFYVNKILFQLRIDTHHSHTNRINQTKTVGNEFTSKCIGTCVLSMIIHNYINVC